MTIQNRNTDALAVNDRTFGRHNLTVLDMSEDPERFLLRLLFLTRNVRNNIAVHFRPVAEGLAGTGNCLIGRGNNFIGLEFLPCGKRRCIGLNRAVGFYRDETSPGSKPLSLIFDNSRVLRIDFRDNHRYVRRPAVRAVVGNNRRLGLCVSFLDLADFLL